MSELCIRICQALLRMEIALTVGSLLVLGVLRYFPIVSPRWQRILCVMVLLQGCLWFRVPLVVPTIPLTSKVGSDSLVANDRVDQNDMLSLSLAEWLERSVISGPTDESSSSLIAIVAMVCLITWLSGVILILGISFGNYWRFLQQCSGLSEVPSSWIDQWNELKRTSEIRHHVSFVVTKEQGPLLCRMPSGYRLIVPETLWATFTTAQRAMILRHELAHLRRGDLWMSLGCHLIAIVHWMNPFVWLLVRRFDEAAEIACDEEVRRNAPTESCQYARTLLCLGSGQSEVLFASQANGRRGLAERIRRLTSFNPRKDSKMKKWSIATLLVALTAANLVQIQTYGEDTSTSPKNSNTPRFGGYRTEANSEYSGFGIVQLPVATLTSEQNEKRTDAVVSIREILKELVEFREQRQLLIDLSASFEESSKRVTVEYAAEQARARQNGTKVDASVYAAYQTKMQELRNQSIIEKNQFYFLAYPKIMAEIELYAKEHGIRVVRAKKLQPSHARRYVSSDVGAAKNETDKTKRSELTGELTFDEMNGIRNKILLNSGVNTRPVQPATATETVNASFQDDNGRVYAAQVKNVSIQLVEAADREVIYASFDDQFDITQAIIDRMNEKFEESGSSSK